MYICVIFYFQGTDRPLVKLFLCRFSILILQYLLRHEISMNKSICKTDGNVALGRSPELCGRTLPKSKKNLDGYYTNVTSRVFTRFLSIFKTGELVFDQRRPIYERNKEVIMPIIPTQFHYDLRPNVM